MPTSRVRAWVCGLVPASITPDLNKWLQALGMALSSFFGNIALPTHRAGQGVLFVDLGSHAPASRHVEIWGPV